MKRTAFIIKSPTERNFGGDVYSHALFEVLEGLDFTPRFFTRGNEAPKKAKEDDIFFFLGHNVCEPYRELPGAKVIVSFHPYGLDYGKWSTKNFSVARKCCIEGHATAIFHYNLHTAQWMQEDGLPAYYAPVGYHESFEAPKVEPYPLGVYILGRSSKRRAMVLSRTKKAHICNWVKESDMEFRRARLLNTDGVHLNLFYIPWRPFYALRVVMHLLSNRRCVVSELADWSPLTDGEHYIEVPAAEIPGVCKELLQDKQRRHELGNAGYEFIKKSHRLDVEFKRALTEAQLI